MPVIPICHRGLSKQQLPYPLSIFQACEAADPEECANLVRRLAEILNVEIAEDFMPEAIAKGLALRMVRGQGIGLILAHGQPDWEKTGDSPFRLPHALPEAWRDRWTFHRILNEDKIAAVELGTLSGMIVGSPCRSTMSAECVDELVDWVHAGGRLLLLGFELGDRHHGGNLGDLARRFGIHPMVDMVGPCDYGQRKPYSVWMDFKPDIASRPPLTKGLDRIRLCNVQTVMVEPGGDEWLRVGEHAVYRPAGKDVQYREGQLTQPRGAQFEVNADAAWVPVGVDAPTGLVHPGAVRFLGTWDLLRAPAEPPHDTLRLVERMLDWLASGGKA
jgi:hypothetical protein